MLLQFHDFYCFNIHHYPELWKDFGYFILELFLFYPFLLHTYTPSVIALATIDYVSKCILKLQEDEQA